MVGNTESVATGSDSSAAAIHVENVSLTYQSNNGAEVLAIDQISCKIEAGKFVVLIGPSGCGKSSLLMMMAGLRHPTQGQILCNGKQIHEPDPDQVGVVFQEANLYPWLTAQKNVEFPLMLRKIPQQERSRLAKEALDLVGLGKFAQSYPHELSGGMKQRVLIAIAIALQPALIIADEPTSALDVTVQAEVLSILDRLVRDRGMGLIFISHDLRLVARFCDRVLVMHKGLVVEEIEAAHLMEARHPYTRGLLNCLPRIGGPRAPLPVLDRTGF